MTTNEPPSRPDVSPPAAPAANKKALWSMALGVASLLIGVYVGLMIIGSVLAISLGFIARGEIKRSQGTQTGSGQALVGIITGFAMIALFVLAIVLVATGVVDMKK